MNMNRKWNLKYSFICLCSLLLFVVAVVAPGFWFRMQDGYQFGNIRQGKHGSLDMEVLGGSYESLGKRLSDFAVGVSQGKKYYVAGTDYRVNQEFYHILENVLGTEQGEFFRSFGIPEPYILLEEIEQDGYDVEKWKKYVIYDDFTEEGVTSIAVMAWYIELNSEDYRIKVLADTESWTIYYLQILENRENDAVKEENINVNEFVVVYDLSEEKKLEMQTFMTIWDYYYETEGTKGETQMKEQPNLFTVENGLDLIYRLNYDSNCLQWEAGGIEEQGILYMGIKEIRQLIPELQ